MTLATRIGAAGAGLLAVVLLAGCGSTTGQVATESLPASSLAETRVAALEQVDRWVFLDAPRHVRDRINAAVSVEEVASVLEVAERENAEIEARYWQCVDLMPGRVAGVWHGKRPDSTGKQYNEYVLTLGVDGQARLELVGSRHLAGQWAPDEVSLWLEASQGQVMSWSQDLDKAVAQRSLPPDWSPVFTGKDGECILRFSLSLDEVVWVSDLIRDSEEDQWTLVLDGSTEFDLLEPQG